VLPRRLIPAMALVTGLVAPVALVASSPALAASTRVGAPPAKVVSLSPTATEMLFAIGAGPQVVAVDDQSSYPKRAPRTDLSGYTPNVEAIAGYEPDLVVVPDAQVKSQLEDLGIDVLVLPAANTLADSYAQLRRLGRATGRTKAAAGVVRGMKADIAGLRAEVPKKGRDPTAYYELDDTYFSADSSSFIGRILALGGFANIADAAKGDSGGYPQLSSEFVVDADPDVVFLADTKCCAQSAASFGARPGFDELTAVKRGAVVPLDDDVASRWGPRVVALLRRIVKEREQL
jgi:iron complex transport system substrate-binding protein